MARPRRWLKLCGIAFAASAILAIPFAAVYAEDEGDGQAEAGEYLLNDVKQALIPGRGEPDTLDKDDYLDLAGIEAEVEEEADSDAGGGGDENEPGREKPWWTAIKPDIEVAYRYSNTKPKGEAGEYGRDLSLTLGLAIEPVDDWELYFALKSGREDRPGSNWVDQEDLNDTLWLFPREYWLRHDQELGKGRMVRWQAGSFNYPFDATQLVFDNDLYMGGAYLEYTFEPSCGSSLDQLKFALMGAQLRADNESDAGPARVVTARAGARWAAGESTRIEGALSLHKFLNEDTLGRAVADGEWRVGGPAGKGETTNIVAVDDPADLVSGYELADAWVSVELNRSGDWPVELTGEYVRNLDADGESGGGDTAYLAGIEVGDLEDAGDWCFGLEHARLESDAVLAAVNRGEYATNYQGTQVAVEFLPFEGMEWKLTYTWSENLKLLNEDQAFDNEELKLYITYTF